jgi:MFS family permease
MNTVFWAIYFQDIIHFSPAKAGLIALIANAPSFISAPLAGILVDRVGPRIPVVLGFACVTFSITWFVFFHASSNYAALMPILLPFGLGFPLIFTPSFVYMMTDVHQHRRGMASAFNNTTRQLAATLGIAIMGSLFFNIQNDEFTSLLSQNPSTHGINPALFEGLLDKTPAALNALGDFPTKTAHWITENYIDAYVKAFDWVNIIAAATGFIGLLIAWKTFKKKVPV